MVPEILKCLLVGRLALSLLGSQEKILSTCDVRQFRICIMSEISLQPFKMKWVSTQLQVILFLGVAGGATISWYIRV